MCALLKGDVQCVQCTEGSGVDVDYQNNSDTVSKLKVISGISSQRAPEDTLSCLGSAVESCGTSNSVYKLSMP